MSKILVVPDIHGKTQVLVKAQSYFKIVDFVVQLGDIVDCEDPSCPDETIWQVFYQWHALKQTNPDKFILLYGNHELAYYYPEKFNVPKHRISMEKKIGEYLRANHDLNIAWEHRVNNNRWLFTHAGVTNSFCQQYSLDTNE